MQGANTEPEVSNWPAGQPVIDDVGPIPKAKDFPPADKTHDYGVPMKEGSNPAAEHYAQAQNSVTVKELGNTRKVNEPVGRAPNRKPLAATAATSVTGSLVYLAQNYTGMSAEMALAWVVVLTPIAGFIAAYFQPSE